MKVQELDINDEFYVVDWKNLILNDVKEDTVFTKLKKRNKSCCSPGYNCSWVTTKQNFTMMDESTEVILVEEDPEPEPESEPLKLKKEIIMNYDTSAGDLELGGIFYYENNGLSEYVVTKKRQGLFVVAQNTNDPKDRLSLDWSTKVISGDSESHIGEMLPNEPSVNILTEETLEPEEKDEEYFLGVFKDVQEEIKEMVAGKIQAEEAEEAEEAETEEEKEEE